MFTYQEGRAATASHASYNYNLPIIRRALPSTHYSISSNNDNVGSFFSSSGGGRGGGGVSSKAVAMGSKGVISFHSSTKWRSYFEASKQSNKLIVLYFTATWCTPCRSMEPIINELAANHPNVDLVKIDVDELFNLSREFGVQTMPTFVFMKNGKEIDKVRGANKEDLQWKVEKHGA